MGTERSDDYYAILGVDSKVDAEELRRTWRRLALQWHPDRAGPGATGLFQKLSAAYQVLSDPGARAVYDLRHRFPSRPPEARSRQSAAASAPIRRAPSVLLHRLSGPLTSLLACGVVRHVDDDTIDLFVDPEEATEGGMIIISMYVPVRCPTCTAHVAGWCARCGMKRTVEELFSAWLALRPGTADGALLAPSTPLPGMVRPVYFRVRMRGAA